MRDAFRALRVREFRLLWLSQVFSEVGDWVARVGIALLVLERTGSALLTGLAVAATLVAWVGPGQILAGIADRHGRRVVMVTCDLVRAGAFIFMALDVPVWSILVLAVAAGFAMPPFEAARSSAQIEVTQDEEAYGASLALSGVTQQGAALVGYLLGGVMAAEISPRVALVVNGASFLVSALLLSRLPRLLPGEHEDAGKLSVALRVILGDKVVLWAIGIATLGSGACIGVETLVPVFSQKVLSQTWATGPLLAGGTVVALLLIPVVPKEGSVRRLVGGASLFTIAGCILVGGLGILGGAGIGGHWAVGAALVLGGVLTSGVLGTNVAAGPRLPSHVRASAMGILLGVMLGWQGAMAALGGALAGAVGVSSAIAILVAMPLVLCALYLAMRPLRSEE